MYSMSTPLRLQSTKYYVNMAGTLSHTRIARLHRHRNTSPIVTALDSLICLLLLTAEPQTGN